MKMIIQFLNKNLHIELVAVSLVDCLLCSSPHSFVSAILMSLSFMLHLDLPHVNILSKMDTLRRVSPEMAFSVEYYLKAGEGNLEHLISSIAAGDSSHPLDLKYKNFIESISRVAEEFSLVGFVPLAIEDKESALHCLAVCDRANGYAFSAEGVNLQEEAVRADTTPNAEFYDGIREKFQAECSHCGSAPMGRRLLKCSACKRVEYCNRDCQRADWAGHKSDCTYKQNL